MAAIPFVIYGIFLSPLILGAYAQVVKAVCNGTQFKEVCTSCTTIENCDDNVILNCAPGLICIQSDDDAKCIDPSNVPQCQCHNSSEITHQCDPYNNAMTITCFDESFQSTEDCSVNDLVCDPSTGKCELPYTTTEMTSTTCAVSSAIPTKINCTAFYFCSAGQYPDIFSCADGLTFSDKVHNCMEYRNFSCAEDAPGMQGLFADPRICSIYYTCLTDGTQATSECPDGEYFDQTVNSCLEEDGTCVNDICTPCKSKEDVFPVDRTTCLSTFNQCTVNPEDDPTTSDDDLIFVLTSCPDGFVYDPVTNCCTRTCTLSKKKKTFPIKALKHKS